MQFHLNYTPPPLQQKIGHTDKILMIGSCFAENIGEHLLKYKFNCLINPNGILFNPISIAAVLGSYIRNENTDPKTSIKNNDRFCNLNYHGDFSFATENELTEAMNSSRQSAQNHLKESNWLIITFGTAYVYRHLETNGIVANCHKLPQNNFKKELLQPNEIIEQYNTLIGALKKFNPKLNILLTVSPVKYLRDGLIENNLSKSILIQSVHQIISSNTNCYYFPAYELVNDDLRDYRFYKEDLAHPNAAAIKYVWNKFSESAFSEETKKLNERIKEILLASSHRALDPESESHKQFKKMYLQKCSALEREFSFLKFNNEIKAFQ